MHDAHMSLPDSDLDRRIAARVRELRAERGLTLEGLAGAAGVSRAMLSRIERGESSPTAQLLGKVCGGLGVTLSSLFAGTDTPASPLSRRDEQQTWRDPATRYLRRSVSPPGTGSPVDIAEIEFPAGASVAFHNPRLPGADQHLWVLEGTLEIELDGDTVRLGTGDCLMMRFGRPVVFRNPTDRPTRYAVIVSHGAPRP
jgi:transcriptional regulator with XRE-family HTH domain